MAHMIILLLLISGRIGMNASVKWSLYCLNWSFQRHFQFAFPWLLSITTTVYPKYPSGHLRYLVNSSVVSNPPIPHFHAQPRRTVWAIQPTNRPTSRCIQYIHQCKSDANAV